MTFEVLVGFDGGLNFVKRWVAAVKDNSLFAFNGVGVALTKNVNKKDKAEVMHA